jgi:integrase
MAKKLTDVAIKNARKPGKTRREIPDGGCRGLYLVVQPSGAQSWAVRYRYEGKPRKLTLDGFPSLATARRLAAAALEKLQAKDEGETPRDPAAEKLAKKRAAKEKRQTEADLFPRVVETYLKHYEEGRATRKKTKPKERTIIETARLLGMQRDPTGIWLVAAHEMPRPAQDAVWGRKRIQDITRRDVVEMLDGIVDRKAPYVANRTYAAVFPLFAWAVRREMIEVSPVVWDKAAEEKRERVLTNDELRWFWRATEGLGHPFMSLFRLLALTGQRRDEVAAMTEDELDMGKRLWTIPGKRTKNRRDHVVPLSDAALDVLRGVVRIKSDKRYIFTTNGPCWRWPGRRPRSAATLPKR